MGPTLVIMAAGMGSRFGGIKQFEPIGPCGEIIMDYSVRDAADAGFKKIVFVISHRIEQDFRAVIWNRIAPYLRGRGVGAACAFQELDDIPCAVPAGRVKPWGTGQAVLAAAGEAEGPFAVINTDDYYGKDAFRKMAGFLSSPGEEGVYAMAGFRLGNTLSENGTVTRGVCREEGGYLLDVEETRELKKCEGGAVSHGTFYPAHVRVSMNMWGFREDFWGLLREGFGDFLREMKDPLRGEFLVPDLVGKLLEAGKVRVRVLETDGKWFGMTYREDAEKARAAMLDMIAKGEYPEKLY